MSIPMEQALSLPHSTTPSPCKSFSISRKRSTNYDPTLQASQASIATSKTPSSSLHAQLSSPSNDSLKQIQTHVIKSGEEFHSFALFNHLINLASPLTSLEIFKQLHRMDAVCSADILIAMLEICGEMVDVCLGPQIHALITKTGLDCDSHMRCSMMDFYEDVKMFESRDKLFEEASNKDSRLWCKAISLNAEREEWQRVFELFREMQFSDLRAEFAIIQVVNVCGKVQALAPGKEIHAHAIRAGVLSNVVVSNSLITMYAKNSLIEDARRVFYSIQNLSLISWNSMISCYCLNGCLGDALKLLDGMMSAGMQPDLVTWNCLISGHSLLGLSEDVFELFRRMQVKHPKPNSSSITSVLRAIGRSGKLNLGKEIHGYVIRHGLECNLYAATALLDMYANCCNLNAARRIFDGMQHKNIVTWNSMISGYAGEGCFQEALELLKKMEREGIQPNLATWNGLITGYALKGKTRQALILIRQLKFTCLKADVISWTALISGCCQNGLFEESLTFFDEMLKDKVKPNSATLATVLRVCAGLAWLKKGAELHCYAMRRSFDEHVYVSTALIDMYCKSGNLRNAYKVFRQLQNKNLATWNALILGFANYGKSSRAFSLFDEMLCSGLLPDSITFTALLTGCRHSGLIDAGWKYFDDMKCKYNITPSQEHYACMVDLLARRGYLDEASDVIQSMPFEPDASVWGALLGACKTHKNLQLAEVAAKNLLRLEPYNSANYLLMMSIYTSENRWDDVENMKAAMKVVGVKSRAGWSWVQVQQAIHVFAVEGEPHPDIGIIYFELYQLVAKMSKLGYVPDTSCIVHNIGENEKRKSLLTHTEKLAITYGLISTGKGVPVRVISSTGVCNDCHVMAKFISGITGRNIYLRDGVRFHHFKDGQCSCSDYW